MQDDTRFYPVLSGLDTRLLATSTGVAPGKRTRTKNDNDDYVVNDVVDDVGSSKTVKWCRVVDDKFAVLGPNTASQATTQPVAGVEYVDGYQGYDVMHADVNMHSIQGIEKRRGEQFKDFETEEEHALSFSSTSCMFLSRPRFKSEIHVPNSAKTGSIYLHHADSLMYTVPRPPPADAIDSILAFRMWARTIDNREYTCTTATTPYATWEATKASFIKPADRLMALSNRAKTAYATRMKHIETPEQRARVAQQLKTAIESEGISELNENYIEGQWISESSRIPKSGTVTDAMAILVGVSLERVRKVTEWREMLRIKRFLGIDDYIHFNTFETHGGNLHVDVHLWEFFSSNWNPYWDLSLSQKGSNIFFGDEEDGSSVMTMEEFEEAGGDPWRHNTRRYAFFLCLEKWIQDTGPKLDEYISKFSKAMDVVTLSNASYLPPLQWDEMFAIATVYTPTLKTEAMGLVATKRDGTDWESSVTSMLAACPWHDVAKIVD